MSERRPSRKERRKMQREERAKMIHGKKYNLVDIQPKTDNQETAFACFDDGKHLLLHGYPGTGKTFVALYLALRAVSEDELDHVYIMRSAVPSRNIGFLPGNQQKKTEVYEAPYGDIVGELYDQKDAYEKLKERGTIKFGTTSFVRGITIDNTCVIIDEFQNLSSMELHTVISRLGENSRLIICGDISQDDLTSERFKEESGANDIIEVLDRMKSISKIEFDADDIVRSGFVREYIIAKEKIEREKRAKQLPSTLYG